MKSKLMLYAQSQQEVHCAGAGMAVSDPAGSCPGGQLCHHVALPVRVAPLAAGCRQEGESSGTHHPQFALKFSRPTPPLHLAHVLL